MTDKAHELLERVLTGIDRYGDIYPETLEEIRAYLAEPEQDEEPVAWIHNGEVYKAKQCRLFSSHPGEEIPGQIPLYLHPAPRKPFVRLSEEEVTEILTSAYDMYAAICATENRLVEKNK